MLVTKHLMINGRVQGVGFRYYVEYKARQFGATGWVRNRLDGSVEAMIQGNAETVDAMITRAHRGPPQSAVAKVAVSDGHGNYTDFQILSTA
jgi:acylphosphatase